jgi:hypothetical protein
MSKALDDHSTKTVLQDGSRNIAELDDILKSEATWPVENKNKKIIEKQRDEEIS